MIWAKRLLAVAVAAGLIVGAVAIRSAVFDGDDDSTEPNRATTLVCLTELATICDAVARDARVSVETMSIDEATAAFADARPGLPEARRVWLTLEPFPDIVDQTRIAARNESLRFESLPVATSDLILAVPTHRQPVLVSACGNPVDWRCLGDAAGHPWEDLSADREAGLNVRPAFPPITTAVGRLGVTAALEGYFGDAPIDPLDPEAALWLRRLLRVVPTSVLSSGSPITALRQRRGLDVAVGALAELGNTGDDTLGTIYAGRVTRIDLVLAVPEGTAAPAGLADSLTAAATNVGWAAPGTRTGDVLAASSVAAATQLWRSAR